MKNFIIKSIFGGILISLGAFCYVSTGMEIIGAILFAFGLISVVLTQSNLFTGKSGFFTNKKEFYDLFTRDIEFELAKKKILDKLNSARKQLELNTISDEEYVRLESLIKENKISTISISLS